MLLTDGRVVDVKFSRDALSVALRDGRTITVPLAWYPRLLKATPAQRKNWRVAGGGFGIHWPDLDEDLSIEGLLRGAPAPRLAAGGAQEKKRRRAKGWSTHHAAGRAAARVRLRMANLIHEIWEEVDENGMVLHSCQFAGPMGDGARALLAPNARLLTRFEAGSHFEAMTIYHRFLGREPYTTEQSWHYEPYPEDWLRKQ